MNKKYLKTMLAALAWGLFSLLPAAGPALAQTPSDPNPQNYQTTPFWLEGTAIPQVMLVLERDWKMYYPAYNNLTNLEGDGDPLNTPDIGFNPAVTYVGYFDPNSCYGYGPPASNAPGYSSTGGGNASRFFRIESTRPQKVDDLEKMIEENGIDKHGRHIPELKRPGSFDPYPSDKLNNWGLKTPLSKHGVCNPERTLSSNGRSTVSGGGNGANGGQWHGNWLNFATTSRMDAIRRVLYGGKRSVDLANRSLLELTPYIPANSHAWGGELYADNVWPKYGKTTAWYDIPSFTAYTRPEAGRMHYWARTTYYRSALFANISKSPDPLFQVMGNIPVSNWNAVYKTPTRFWDWVGDHGPGAIPNDSKMSGGPARQSNASDALAKRFPPPCDGADPANYDIKYVKDSTLPDDEKDYLIRSCYDRITGSNVSRGYQDFATSELPDKPGGSLSPQAGRRYIARVEACEAGNIGSGDELCRDYGGNKKPAGLLQDYGESGRMLFGLLTGSINATTRWQGGVVRHHIQAFSNYVDGNGIFRRPGLMDTMDRFQVTGYGGSTYTDGTAAGNPLGTMVFEAVRYLAHRSDGRKTGLAPTSAYSPSSEVGLPPYNNQSGSATALPRLTVWDETNTSLPARPYLGVDDSDCSKPVILVLSEVISDHDSDTFSFPSAPPSPSVSDSTTQGSTYDANFTSTFPSASFPNLPLLRSLAGKGVPQAFDVKGYLRIITEQEKLNTSLSKQKFFFADKPRGVCRPQNLKDSGLASLSGHCPSEPSLMGSYSLAAVAYYAHTHDAANLAGASTAGQTEKSIDLFAVGIPGNFPDVNLKLDEKHHITFMPITVSSDNGSTPFRTLINFYMLHWETDINGIPIKLKFATNFEYTTTVPYASGSGSNNHERDIFSQFEITLLIKAVPGNEDYRESMPTFINSGVLKTCPNIITTSTGTSQNLAHQTSDCMKAWFDRKNLYKTDSTAFDTTTSGDQTWRDRYYYAFKNPPDKDLDVTKWINRIDDIGVAVQIDTHGSNINIAGHGGYSINGTTADGVYLDAGFYGSGAPDSGTTPNGPTCGPNATQTLGTGASPTGGAGTQADGCKYFENKQVLLTADYPDPYFWSPSGGADLYTNTTFTNATRMRGLPPGHRNPTTPNDPLLTPWECPLPPPNDSTALATKVASVPGLVEAYCGTANPTNGCLNSNYLTRACGTGSTGTGATITGFTGGNWFPPHPLNRYFQVRGFKFDPEAVKVKPLPNPMWLAAKYGGFNDYDGTGLPDNWAKWSRSDCGDDPDPENPKCDPRNYFRVSNLSQLPQQLGEAFEAISKGIATGTANAASISTVLGGGLSIQTQYYTEYTDPDNSDNKLKWLGTVYALFVDKWGNLRADTNVVGGKVGDQRLQLATNPPERPGEPSPGPEKGDLIVHTIPPAEGEIGELAIYLCRDVYGNNNGGFFLPDYIHPSPGNPAYPPDSDCQKVNSMDEVPMVWHAGAELSRKDPADRKIYTYYGPAPGDGSAIWPAEERDMTRYPLSATDAGNLARLRPLLRQTDNAAGLQNAADLINYIRGTDFPNKPDDFRNRTAKLPWSGQRGVWRLGDIINSRPIIVGDPAGNYHLLYRDQSYADYKASTARRRQVVYVGSNDGVLHAFNLGFFGSLKTGEAGYTIAEDPEQASGKYAFGEEMWGYVPKAVLPHLAWLADPEYRHSYYVDQQPYIMDVKDGNTWKTIMIVGLRLGGRTIALDEAENDISYSEFFALDVTNPEAEPRLLWRYSSPSLGLTSASPTVVRNGNNWYVVLPSGPTSDLPGGRPDPLYGYRAYDGISTQNARLIVLDALTGQYARARDRDPGSTATPDPLTASEANSFFNGSFLPVANHLIKDASGGTQAWSHHAVYLGLTAKNSVGDVGSVYRLQMADANGTPLPVDSWRLAPFYRADKPITGAVNSTYDNVGNLWVVFGSGRIWSNLDQVPCGTNRSATGAAFEGCCDNHEQYFFGLKEPLGANGRMTFAEVGGPADKPIVDVSHTLIYGQSGVLAPPVSVPGAPEPVEFYGALYTNMIAKDSVGDPVVRGYKRKLESLWVLGINEPGVGKTRFEIVTTQPQIDGLANGRSNTVFTSYLTNDNVCNPVGDSFLNVIDTYTGLPHPEFLGYGGFEEGNQRAFTDSDGSSKLLDQSTGVKRSGKGMASEAWILKTGEGTVYGNTSFNSNRNRIYLPSDQSDRSAIVSWREVLDMGFSISEADLFNDLR